MILKISKKILVACFSLAFIVQFAEIIYETAYPSVTTTNVAEEIVESFPMIFKICPNPAFKMQALLDFGYYDIYTYFLGQSRFNHSIYGWAGHTENTSTIAPPEEIYPNITLFPNLEDLLLG